MSWSSSSSPSSPSSLSSSLSIFRHDKFITITGREEGKRGKGQEEGGEGHRGREGGREREREGGKKKLRGSRRGRGKGIGNGREEWPRVKTYRHPLSSIDSIASAFFLQNKPANKNAYEVYAV